jgi:hypothetical protein
MAKTTSKATPSTTPPAETAANSVSGPRSLITFEGLDQNKDKGLAKEEVSGDPVLSTFFAKWDQDKDGKLSEEEYMAYAKANYLLGQSKPAPSTKKR